MSGAAMLRWVVLLLVMLNAAYFVWSQGGLPIAGLAPATQAEPQRLKQQIRPEMMRVLPPADAQRFEAEALPRP